MAKVDRLGWADGIAFSPRGASIGIRTNDPSCLAELKEIVGSHDWEFSEQEEVQILFSLRVGPRAKKGRKNFHLLYLGASRVVRSLDLSDVFKYLRAHMLEIVMATARDAVFVPGSVVSLADRLLVLPGQSGSGRTTLLAELKERGAEILAESYFAVDPEGNLETKDVASQSLGQEQVKAPPLVCFTEYTSRNKTLRARALTPGESSLFLFASGLSSRSQPAMVLGAVAQFATKAQSLRGKRGEASQAADYLLRKIKGIAPVAN